MLAMLANAFQIADARQATIKLRAANAPAAQWGPIAIYNWLTLKGKPIPAKLPEVFVAETAEGFTCGEALALDPHRRRTAYAAHRHAV